MRFAFWKKQQDNQDIKTKKKKGVLREWADALIFAVVAATIIRTFFFEAYTIPTGSMEGSLLVNDYLFVSKLAYGPRVPMTPLAVPLVHNTMPITGGKSYTEAVKWDYHRWWGFGNIKRNDVVVFNFPNGDTVVAEQPDKDYYQILRDEFGGNRELLKSQYTVITRPVDKKENYIKRCVGVSGDKIEVKDGLLYVNDQPAEKYPHSKLSYKIDTKAPGFNEFIEDNNMEVVASNGVSYILHLANDQVENVKKQAMVKSVTLNLYPQGFTADGAYPQDTAHFKWNRDHYGPIIIPKEGTTVTITTENISLYKRIIVNYEKNTLEQKGDKFIINGKETNTYTFKMNYYWMMGDNRHNSADSRYFGFVPIDHVVGKASFVWFSNAKSLFEVRWNRLFRSIHSLEK